MSRLASGSRAVRRALQALSGFVGAVKVGAGDLTVSLDLVPERGLADSGDLNADLTALIESVGEEPCVDDRRCVRVHTRINYWTPRNDARAIFGLHED